MSEGTHTRELAEPGAESVGDTQSLMARGEMQETEEAHDLRLKRGLRDAIHFTESLSIRGLFVLLSLCAFPIGLAVAVAVVSLTVHYFLPWSWLPKEGLDDLVPFVLAVKDGITGAVSGSALTLWVLFRRWRADR